MSVAIVALNSWERDHAVDVGRRRHEANLARGDAPWYDPARMEDNLTANIVAAVAEQAVAKYTNSFWSGHVWPVEQHDHHKDLPDVGRNIEVRTVRTSQKAAVRRHQLGKGLALWVAKPIRPELSVVEVWGSLPMEEAWTLGEVPHWDVDGTSRVVHRRHLRLPQRTVAGAA